MNFYLLDNQKRKEKLTGTDPKELWIVPSIRVQGIKNDRLAGTLGNATNKINLLDWINNRIADGDINIPSGGADGNGIYDGGGTVPDGTVATLEVDGEFRIDWSSSLGPAFELDEVDNRIALISNDGSSYLSLQSDLIQMGTTYHDLVLNNTGDAIIYDNTASPKGVIYNGDYSSTFVNESLVSKRYSDSRLGGRALFNTPNPTNGQVYAWNNTNSRFELTTPAGGGTTNLTMSGASSPVTLASDTGTDVTFTAGTNVTLAQASNNLTINAAPTDLSFTILSGGARARINSSTGTDITLTGDASGVTFVDDSGELSISAPATNLTLTGTSPVTLNSSTGTDVTFTQGHNITLTRTSNDLSFAQDNPVFTSEVGLTAALAHASSVIVVNSVENVSGTVTFPSTKHLVFWPGGRLNFTSNTVTFNSSFEGPKYQQLFSFASTTPASFTAIAAAKTTDLSVCWFGADPTNTNDDSVAGNFASAWLKRIGGGVLYYPAGSYNHYGTVFVWSNTTVKGDGWNTVIHAARTNAEALFEASPIGHAASYSRSSIFRIGNWTEGVSNVEIKDMYLYGYYGIVTSPGPQTAIMADIGYATKEQYHQNLRFHNLYCYRVQMLCTLYRAGGREFPNETTWFRHKGISVTDCTIDIAGNKAIEIQEGERIHIANNTILNAQDGIQVIHSCKSFVIADNYVEFEDTGIAIANGGEEGTITGNTVRCTGTGPESTSEPNGFGGALHMKWDNWITGSTTSEVVKNVTVTGNVFDVSFSTLSTEIRSMAWHWGTNWTVGSVTKFKVADNIFINKANAIHAISPHVRPATTTWDDVEFINNSFYGGLFGDINQTTTGQVRVIGNYIEGNATFNQLDALILKDNIFDGTVTINSGCTGTVLSGNIFNGTLTDSGTTTSLDVTRRGTTTATTDANGVITVTLSPAMPSNTYTVTANAQGSTGTSLVCTVTNKTTSSFDVQLYNIQSAAFPNAVSHTVNWGAFYNF